MAIDISTPEELRAWLQDKPRDWGYMLALRTSLRVVPMALDPQNWVEGRVRVDLAMTCFRVLSVFFANDRFGIINKDSERGYDIAGTYAMAASVVAGMGLPADDRFRISESVTSVFNAISNKNSDSAAFGAVHSATFAFSRVPGGDEAAVWEGIQHDCEYLASSGNGSALKEHPLSSKPLWRETPSWWNEAWDRSRVWLSSSGQGFEIWREWYFGRLGGLPHAFKNFDDGADRTFYTFLVGQNDQWWKREPAKVNADIKALVDSLRSPEVHTTARVDFFISYANEDEAIAREVAAVLEDLGKSYIVQYRDFAQGNWINEMDAAMERADRLIPIYSQHYVASHHCKAEWNHFYKLDPSAAERRIVAFRLDHADLKPLMDQIVYKDLTGLFKDERLSAIRTWVEWKPSPITRETVATFVTTLLDPGVVKTEDGKLDTSPDPDLNKTDAPVELARAMEELRMMLELVLQTSLNLSSIMQNSLRLYGDHLADKKQDTSWGGLDRYVAVLTDGLETLSDTHMREERIALEQFIAAHSKCMAALQNVDEQRRQLANLPLENADQPVIEELINNLQEVTRNASEFGATTDAFDDHAQNLVDQGREIAFEAGAPGAEQKPSIGRQRFLRYVGGFAISTVTVIGSLASIRGAPETQKLLIAGEKLIESFFRLVGI